MFTLKNLSLGRTADSHMHVEARYGAMASLPQGVRHLVTDETGENVGFMILGARCIGRKRVRTSTFFQRRACGCCIQAMDVAGHVCADHLRR